MADLSGWTADGTAFEVTGPAAGPPVVLIHGLGLSRALWDPHIDLYADRYRTITYDLYGHGHSGPVPQEMRPVSLSEYSTQLINLLDELSVDTAHLVGFSIGGMINRRFALDHRGRVASLVVMSSPHDRGRDGQGAVEARAAAVRDQGAMSTMNAALKRWFTPGHLANFPDHEQAVRAWRQAADPESYAQAAWVLANGVRELIDPDRQPSAPTFVLTGSDDTGSTAAMTAAIAKAVDGATSLVVDGYRHLGLMESPEAFSAPVRAFLDSIAPDGIATGGVAPDGASTDPDERG